MSEDLQDRDLADLWRRMIAGEYTVAVANWSPFGMAQLKSEGTTNFAIEGKSYTIKPTAVLA
jgi:hypothetical protein